MFAVGFGKAKLSEQGLDLRNIANKALPSWLLSELKAHAINASSCPDAILFLPSTVCSSRVTTRNSIFQQLAKDKKLNPNQWEMYLIDRLTRLNGIQKLLRHREFLYRLQNLISPCITSICNKKDSPHNFLKKGLFEKNTVPESYDASEPIEKMGI